MKKSLGKILLLLLFAALTLDAKELATYSLTANKTDVYEKEAVLITFKAEQKDHTDNMMFSLQPKPSQAYTIELLEKKIDDTHYHNASTIYTYLLFPTKAQTLHIDFDFTIRTASDGAVAHSYVDDHDGSLGIQTYNTKKKIQPLVLHVKPLKQKVDFVGDFTLKEKLTKTSITQYDSLSVIYTLQGVGYETKNLQLIKNIPDVTLFSETNDMLLKANKHGHSIKREYIYALSAKHDFTIPKLSLKAFSPKTGEYYTLTLPAHSIKVTKIDTATLLDKENAPQSKDLLPWQKIQTAFIYLMVFLFGYFTAKLQPFSLRAHKKERSHPNIRDARDAKTLLSALMHSGLSQRFEAEIQLLEDMVYNNAEHNFKKIKDSVVKGLS